MRRRIVLALTGTALAAVLSVAPAAAEEPPHSFKLDVETGTWEPFSPGPCAFQVDDAVALANGNIAVFERTRAGAALVEVFSPDTGTMTRVALDTWTSFAWGQFVVGSDGRLYSAYWTVDPSVEPWHVEASTRYTLVDHSGSIEPPMGIATNGLGYLLDAFIGGERLVELDLATDTELRRTSRVDGDNWWVIAGEPRDRVYLIHHWDGIIASYDAADDTWRTESSPYHGPTGLERGYSAFGPDDRVYTLNDYHQPSTLWAWDPTSDEWLSVGQPSDLQYWYPELVAAEGQLYAFAGTNDARLIDEGESAEGCQVAAPEMVPTATPVVPDTALPAPARSDERPVQMILLTVLLVLGTVGVYSRLHTDRSRRTHG